MRDGKQRTYLDFSLTPSWSGSRELWEYIWSIYRIAEPPHERTKAGDAFGELLKETESKREWWTGEAIAIPREKVYQIVERHVARPQSNYLLESKPPHKFLRRFAASTIDQEAIAARLGVRFGFRGFPLIGWTRSHVWFGVTHFPQLWAHAADVRAHALGYPFRPMPEFLRLRWSPVPAQWWPPFGDPPLVDETREHGRNSAGEWRAIRNHPFLVVDTVGKLSTPDVNRFSFLAVETGDAFGFAFNRATATIALCSTFAEWRRVPAAPRTVTALRSTSGPGPDAVLVASTDEQLRTGLAALEAERGSKVFATAIIVTPLPIEAVAERVHVTQAQSEHPVMYQYMRDEDLVRYVRHFPWIFYPGASLRLKGDTLPQQLLLVCFLAAWRSLYVWWPHLDELRACWQALGLDGDFDALVNTLSVNRMLTIRGNMVNLSVRWFEESLPTDSAFTALRDRIEDWVLERGSLMSGRVLKYSVDHDKNWASIIHHIVSREMNAREPWEKARPHRAVYALQRQLELHPNDANGTATLAGLLMLHFDINEGLRLLVRARTLDGPHGPQTWAAIKELTRHLDLRDIPKQRLRLLLRKYCDGIAAGRRPRLSKYDLDIDADVDEDAEQRSPMPDRANQIVEVLRDLTKSPARTKALTPR